MQKTTKSKDAVWISFDLGVQGDYEGLYRWLDEYDAEECGDSVAFLNYEHTGDLRESLRKSIKVSVEINNRSRIYVVHEEEGKIRGKFIIGSRKRPAWSGYAVKQGQGEDSSA